jgi:hypothetical protein
MTSVAILSQTRLPRSALLAVRPRAHATSTGLDAAHSALDAADLDLACQARDDDAPRQSLFALRAPNAPRCALIRRPARRVPLEL